MPIRKYLAIALLVIVLSSAGPANAQPAPDPDCSEASVLNPEECHRKRVTVGIDVGGGKVSEVGVGAGVGADAGAVVAGPRVCTFAGREVPCEETAGSWSHAVNAWCSRLDPQPPYSDPVWENSTEGAIYRCTRPGGSLVPDPSLSFSRRLTPSDVAPLPDPETVARQLLAELSIEAIDLGMHRRGDTKDRMLIVGWHAWMWAEEPAPNQWGSLTNSRSVGGLLVSLSATASEIVWEMGNGDTVSCGVGTKWTLSRGKGGQNVESPDCGYMYEERGLYTVTATTVWDVRWSAGGQSGTLPLEVSRSAEVMVGELQSVLVGSR